MTDTTFQDRMQRIQATQGDAFERDYPDYSQTGRRIPTKVAKAERGPFWGIALMPMMLLVGFASVVVPRVLMHHYVSGPSLLLSNGQSSAVGIYEAMSAEYILSGVVIVMLLVYNQWLAIGAHFLGSYLAGCYEYLVAEKLPWIWCWMYGQDNVTVMLSYLPYYTEPL